MAAYRVENSGDPLRSASTVTPDGRRVSITAGTSPATSRRSCPSSSNFPAGASKPSAGRHGFCIVSCPHLDVVIVAGVGSHGRGNGAYGRGAPCTTVRTIRRRARQYHEGLRDVRPVWTITRPHDTLARLSDRGLAVVVRLQSRREGGEPFRAAGRAVRYAIDCVRDGRMIRWPVASYTSTMF